MHSTQKSLTFPTLRMASLFVGAFLASVPSAQAAFVHKLLPNDSPSPRDFEFGVSIALEDDLALVGARVNGITGTGAAYLFNAKTGQQLRKLVATDVMQDDEFGYSVALSGNIALVGARFSNVSKGAAYVFDITTGEQLHKFEPSGYSFPISITLFGDSVALSGTKALIGAPYEGAAYLFDAVTGQQLRKFSVPLNSDAFSGRFGASVAISGNLAIVQAPEHEPAFAYVYDITTGNLLKSFPTPDGFNLFDSIGLDGNTALVRDRGNNHAGNNSGAAHLHDAITGQLLHTLVASDAAPEDYFGESVALSENRALVGAQFSDGVHSLSGAAYLFDATTGEQLARITSPDDAPGSRFARIVALNGDQALIGGSWRDQAGRNRGAAYLYQVDAGIAGDFDSDGDVDGRDFLVWQRDPSIGNLADWQASYGTNGVPAVSIAIPEPSSTMLAVLAFIISYWPAKHYLTTNSKG